MTDSVSTVRAQGGMRPRRRTLLVMIGDDVEMRPLPVVGVVGIGRGTACDIRIDHRSISRDHLRLELRDGVVVVTDRGGANGTALRGAKLPAGTEVEVSANEPIQLGEVVIVVQDVMAWEPAAEVVGVRDKAAAAAVAPVVIDPAMKRLYELASRVARGTIGVLVVGETGAGKELLAEHIHRSSPRVGGPLVRLNCAALTESVVESELFGHDKGAFTGAARDHRGLLETANGGTAFLDELGELSPAVQAKLLRAVEDRRVTRVGSTTPRAIDVRFVAATNRDLEAEVEAGRFRRDLYFRLAGCVLAIPPLRERPSEIEAIARRSIDEVAARIKRRPPVLAPGAIAALHAYSWPGNIRELRNVIERAVLLVEPSTGGSATQIDANDLGLGSPAPTPGPRRRGADLLRPPGPTTPTGDLADELANVERERILDALARCDGNQTRAAALIGMPRRTFVKRLDRYNLPRPRK